MRRLRPAHPRTKDRRDHFNKIKDAAEMGATSSTEGARYEEFISSRFFITNMAPLLCNGCLRSCAVVFTGNAWTGANSKRANEASHARRCKCGRRFPAGATHRVWATRTRYRWRILGRCGRRLLSCSLVSGRRALGYRGTEDPTAQCGSENRDNLPERHLRMLWVATGRHIPSLHWQYIQSCRLGFRWNNSLGSLRVHGRRAGAGRGAIHSTVSE